MHDLHTALAELAHFCAAHGVEAWLVGGAARDLARGEVPTDLDVAVATDGYQLARAYADVRGASFVGLDEARATGRVVITGAQPLTLDLAGLRAPTIEADLALRDFTLNALALPLHFWTQPTVTFADRVPDAAWLDPTDGLADLRVGVLRPCSPTSLADDPLRVVRAARFCARLGVQPHASLRPLMLATAPALANVAAERISDELLKLLDAPVSAPWLHYLDACGALTVMLPELEAARTCSQPIVHFLPVLAHSLETVAALDWLLSGLFGEDSVRLSAASDDQPEPAWLPVAVQTHPGLTRTLPFAETLAPLLGAPCGAGHYRRAALLKLAALLHDNAKPLTRVAHPDGTVTFYGHQSLGAERAALAVRRLRLSRRDGRYITLIIREHMRPGQLRTSEVLTMRAVSRLFRDLGDAGPDLLLHELADHLATRGPNLDPAGWQAHLAWVELLLQHYYAPPMTKRQPLLNGHELMAACNLQQGPQLGTLLQAIAEAQAVGEITTRDQALELARAMLASAGSEANTQV
ncbi:HD domain-containing protein [Candidatus Chloroploca sp. Khr17]|uniref:HD domain-containing protein n=1 Tax=Candidatus Chloroploca sp. Khr17 TaxID=2496869 RepID=UPI00101CF400|nr:HD domain-containing protein [Candidatus Chloroploca sp. Khr17]